MNKIDELANWFLGNGNTVFGGYVRDKLLGETPTDLDVSIPFDTDVNRLVFQLSKRSTVQTAL